MNRTTNPPARRDFLLKAASMLGVTLCGSALSSVVTSCDYDVLKPADVSAISGIEVDLNVDIVLQQTGGAIRRTFGAFNGGRNVVIIRQNETEFLVVTAVCTHQGCDVNLPTSLGANIQCPCHGAQFSSTSGDVVQGPATLPLKKYPYRFDAARNVLVLNPGASSNGPDEPLSEIKLDISKEPDLQTTGGAVKKTFAPYNDGREVIIIRQGATQFFVVTSVCNHQGCSVNLPASPGANMICPCHGAQYSSLDGTWQPSPQTASDLRTFQNSFDTGTGLLTIKM